VSTITDVYSRGRPESKLSTYRDTILLHNLERIANEYMESLEVRVPRNTLDHGHSLNAVASLVYQVRQPRWLVVLQIIFWPQIVVVEVVMSPQCLVCSEIFCSTTLQRKLHNL
jgi:hypothetical protein